VIKVELLEAVEHISCGLSALGSQAVTLGLSREDCGEVAEKLEGGQADGILGVELLEDAALVDRLEDHFHVARVRFLA